MKIHFQGLIIYFQGMIIYFQALKINCSLVVRHFMSKQKRLYMKGNGIYLLMLRRYKDL